MVERRNHRQCPTFAEVMLPAQACEFCEKEIPRGATVCPLCGRPQRSRAELSRYYRNVALAIVLTLAIMFAWGKLVGFH